MAYCSNDAFIPKHVDYNVVHGTITSQSGWSSHCYPVPAYCSGGRRGASTVSPNDPQWGMRYRFMLGRDDPNGHPLGKMLFAVFNSSGLGSSFDCDHYGQWCYNGADLYYRSETSFGPLFTTQGHLVEVSLASDTWVDSCRVGACAVATRAKLANHRASFTAGPNAIWHLAVQTFESDYYPVTYAKGAWAPL